MVAGNPYLSGHMSLEDMRVVGSLMLHCDDLLCCYFCDGTFYACVEICDYIYSTRAYLPKLVSSALAYYRRRKKRRLTQSVSYPSVANPTNQFNSP